MWNTVHISNPGKKRKAAPAALCGILSILIVFLLPCVNEAEELNDVNISLAVDRELANDVNIPAHLIFVTTDNGIVSLTGTVDNLLAKERSEKIAATVRGVRSVVNRIVVLPFPVRTDEAIKKDVVDALQYNPATESYKIEVAVKDGLVTLNGTVDSFQQGVLSGKVAKTVDGVVGLQNNLIYRSETERTDREIKAEAEQRLFWNVWINQEAFDLEVEDGHVKISGIARSLEEMNRVKYVAWVDGVKSVEVTGVAVDWLRGTETLRAKRPYLKSDTEIRKAVEDAFHYDPRLTASNIDVRVNSGIVSLVGTAASLQAKNAAEEDARNTYGVLRVNNWIKVQPVAAVAGGKKPDTLRTAFADKDVLERVNDALAKNRYVTADQVKASVFLGRVYLTGTVESFFEKKTAAETAARQKGVVDVKNNIDVYLGLPESEDWEILQDIRTELFWSPFVDENQVSVSVKDGTAYLSGEVDNINERYAAEKNAYDGGAVSVINHLAVRNHPYY